MKYLLEFNDFLKTIDFADLVTAETKSRSKPLTKEQFIKLFKENCKNFSFDNTQLYRGNILKADTDFFYIDNTEIRGHETRRGGDFKPYYQKADYNIRLKEPEFKDLPDRNRAIIGSTHPKGAMITLGDVWGDSIQEDRTFIIIPFDNIEIAVAPILDLQAIKRIIPGGEFKRSDFKLIRYNKGFKIPGVNSKNTAADAKEIWTEGPCLLLRYKSLNWFKKFLSEESQPPIEEIEPDNPPIHPTK